jgi:hypothetical protein
VTTLLLTPFLVIALTSKSPYSLECLDVLVNLLHITSPRPNGLVTPFSFGVMTFFSVTDRNPIRKFTRRQSGIYCWINNVNGNCYVGKANDLYLRISNYYQVEYITKTLGYSAISRAVSKYGMESFSLVILQINPLDLAQAEQDWINILTPQYNILTNVLVPYDPLAAKPNRFGVNNSFYGRNHTESTKQVLRDSALKRLTPNRPGFQFIIEDTLSNTTTVYTSIRKGVDAMGWNQPNIMRYLRNDTGKLYLKRYKLLVIR